MNELIVKVVSHYRILEQIGQGGMGVVYKAEDMNLDRFVALKFLPPHLSQSGEEKRRFIHEAKAASALDHPNICTIYEIDETKEGQMFIAMAFYEGEPLNNIVGAGHVQPLPLDRANDYAIQIAEGLTKAHAKGIIHRDIKPANILITEDEQVKIVDFGLAKLAGRTVLTKEGTTLGTVAYMSPEQAQGAQVDHRTDIWALGSVLYEMVTGKQPFQGDYEQAVVYSIMNEDVEPVTGLRTSVPMELERIINKALAKNPDERYQHVDEILVDLKAVSKEFESGTTILPSKRGQTPESKSWGKFAKIAAPALLLLVIIVGLVMKFQHEQRETSAPVSRTAIAVLPFTVRGGEDIAYLREGMVHLLSTKLDGVGELRSVDPHAVLSFVARKPDRLIDPAYGQEIAQHFGAGQYILGSVLQVGERIQFNAALGGLNGSSEIKAEAVAAKESELLTAVDDLAQQLVAGQFLAPGQRLVNLAVLTTRSLPAMKAFLAGERELRGGRFARAVEALQQAVVEDSTFALGWYRLSIAAGWGVDQNLALEAAKRALQLSANLPERVKALVRANYAFDTADAPEAERLLREILAHFPDDVTAWQRFGDLLFHYNPLYGRSSSEAREPLERALFYDPNNAEITSHLFEIAALERRFTTIDSMANHAFAGAEESWRIRVKTVQALAHGRPEERQEMLAELRKADPSSKFTAANRASRLLKEVPFAQQVSKMLTEPQNPDYWQAIGHLMNGADEVAEGRFHDDSVYQPAQSIAPGWVLVSRALNFAHLYSTATKTELVELRQEIVNWDTLRAPFSQFWANGEDMHPRHYADIKAYLSGLLSFRLKDYDAVTNYIQFLQPRARLQGEGSLVNGFAKTLEALMAWQQGKPAKALAALEQGQIRFNPVSEFILPEQALARYLRAELLAEMGRYPEALRWYAALVDGADFTAPIRYLGPSYVRRAEIYEKLGNTDRAIEFYSRFVELWQNCDEELRPMVEDARQKLKHLLEQKTKEPAEKQKQMQSDVREKK